MIIIQVEEYAEPVEEGVIIDPHHDLHYYTALWYLLPQETPFSTFRLPTPGAAGWGGVSPLAVNELLPVHGRRKGIASFRCFRKKVGQGNITMTVSVLIWL